MGELGGVGVEEVGGWGGGLRCPAFSLLLLFCIKRCRERNLHGVGLHRAQAAIVLELKGVSICARGARRYFGFGFFLSVIRRVEDLARFG